MATHFNLTLSSWKSKYTHFSNGSYRRGLQCKYSGMFDDASESLYSPGSIYPSQRGWPCSRCSPGQCPPPPCARWSRWRPSRPPPRVHWPATVSGGRADWPGCCTQPSRSPRPRTRASQPRCPGPGAEQTRPRWRPPHPCRSKGPPCWPRTWLVRCCNAGLWLADVTCTPQPRPGSRWSSPACSGHTQTCPLGRPTRRTARDKNRNYSSYVGVLIKYPPWYAVTYSALFWRILFHFYTISKNKGPIPLGHKDSLSKIMIEHLIIDWVRWNPPSGPLRVQLTN